MARQTLIANGVHQPVRIILGVEQWDNGYWFSGITRVENNARREVRFPDRIIDALERALDEPITELACDNGPIGRFDSLRIDLIDNTVSS